MNRFLNVLHRHSLIILTILVFLLIGETPLCMVFSVPDGFVLGICGGLMILLLVLDSIEVD